MREPRLKDVHEREWLSHGAAAGCGESGLLDRFRSLESDLFVLVSAQALGRGQNLPGVKYVICQDARTTMAVHSLNMKPGDEAEFYRDPKKEGYIWLGCVCHRGGRVSSHM